MPPFKRFHNLVGVLLTLYCISEPVSGWKQRPPCIPPFVLEIRRLLRLTALRAFVSYLRLISGYVLCGLRILVWPAGGAGSPSRGSEAKCCVPKSLGGWHELDCSSAPNL